MCWKLTETNRKSKIASRQAIITNSHFYYYQNGGEYCCCCKSTNVEKQIVINDIGEIEIGDDGERMIIKRRNKVSNSSYIKSTPILLDMLPLSNAEELKKILSSKISNNPQKQQKQSNADDDL
eukprot:489588_1